MKRVGHWAELTGAYLVGVLHLLGLFVIGGAILWASWAELLHIIDEGGPRIKDILLLFVYLEFGAMVGIYFKTNHLSVRFLIYIAITAQTRVLAIDVKQMSDEPMLTITGSILLVCLAVVALGFASWRFPSANSDDAQDTKV